MNVKRYFAKTAREALKLLKEDLGPDAVVLSNRAMNGGVEILALPSGEVASLQSAQRAARSQAPAAPQAPTAPAPASAVAQPRAALEVPSPSPAEDFRNTLAKAASPRKPAVAPAAPAPAAAAPKPEMQPFNPPRVELNRDLFNAAANRAKGADEAARSPLRPESVQARDARETREKQIREQQQRELQQREQQQREQQREQQMREQQQRELREREAREREARERDASRVRAAGIEEEARIRTLESSNAQMATELSAIRSMIEHQLAGFAWGELSRNAPGRARLIGDLLETGFSANLARELAECFPENESTETARRFLFNALSQRFRAMSKESDIVDRGGVYALVGPTGVGKTTTTAKLAARCVVRHGADKLALITTDSYRIGAHEQLRIYGRILGVPVFVVRDAKELRDTLAGLRSKHMVLIDNMGMSQRDKNVAEQACMLTGAGDVSRLLLLNATARGDTLDDVIKAYGGSDLAGVIFTKTDETMSLAPALDAAIRNQLEVFYVANGQRVPEDLQLPNRARLLGQALRELPEASPFRLDPAEAGILMSNAAQGAVADLRGGL
ncbi:MAG: flagellar biosynthesis protein FlhF [Rhodocyclales bacterium]|nr:flagellar biosynthesis protein FlhF [Rhodocyclales bacterium]